MRKSVEDYIRKCDSCQRRKERICGSIREIEQPVLPFEVTFTGITGPCLVTPRRNKHLLTFIDHFIKHVEAYPVPD